MRSSFGGLGGRRNSSPLDGQNRPSQANNNVNNRQPRSSFLRINVRGDLGDMNAAAQRFPGAPNALAGDGPNVPGGAPGRRVQEESKAENGAQDSRLRPHQNFQNHGDDGQVHGENHDLTEIEDSMIPAVEDHKSEEGKEEENKSNNGSVQADDNNSCQTLLSDIAEEDSYQFGNAQGFNNPDFNQFQDNFLLMKSIQWQKDSHGLFDYEMRQITKLNFRVRNSTVVLRKGQTIKFEDPGSDIREKFGDEYQELFKIHKIRNKYFIEGVEPQNQSQDIDENYMEGGEPTLPPIEMRERMYNVVRFLKVQSQMRKQDYQLKKNDVVKMGRVKLKVKAIHINDKIKVREQKVARRKQRLENERLKFKEDQGKVVEQINSCQNQNQEFVSRYPPDYDEISLASDRSYYEPLVGEVNYVEAPGASPQIGDKESSNRKSKCSEKFDVDKDNAQILKKEDGPGPSSLVDIMAPARNPDAPVAPPSQPSNIPLQDFLRSSDQSQAINNPQHPDLGAMGLRNFPNGDGASSPRRAIPYVDEIEIYNPGFRFNRAALNENEEIDADAERARQNRMIRDQLQRGRQISRAEVDNSGKARDATGNFREEQKANNNQEEQKENVVAAVRPSTLLQQIQRDFINIADNQPSAQTVNDDVSSAANPAQGIPDQRLLDLQREQENFLRIIEESQSSVNSRIVVSVDQNSNAPADPKNIVRVADLPDEHFEIPCEENKRDLDLSNFDDINSQKMNDVRGNAGSLQLPENNSSQNLYMPSSAIPKQMQEVLDQRQKNSQLAAGTILRDKLEKMKNDVADVPQQENGGLGLPIERGLESVHVPQLPNIHNVPEDHKLNEEQKQAQKSDVAPNGGPNDNNGESSSYSSSSLSSHHSNPRKQIMRQERKERREKRQIEKEKKRKEEEERKQLESEQMPVNQQSGQNPESKPENEEQKIDIENLNIKQPSQDAKKDDETPASNESGKNGREKVEEKPDEKQSIAPSENLAQCRLCWDNEFTVDNPLLQICKCRGGVEFIHFECVRGWLKTKEYRQSSVHYTSIYWRQFQCEICKTSLPYVFRNNGRSYCLIEIPVLETDYLILESLTLESKHSRMVHILHPRNDVVREFDGKYLVGRGQDCDLKVSDISVSRNHCQIQFKKEKNGSKFWLQDSLSKFGTLALARGLVEILPGTTTGMQIGRTLMIFQTRSIFQKDLQVGNQIIRATEDSQIQYEKEKKERKQAKVDREKERKKKKGWVHYGKKDALREFELACLEEFDFEDYLQGIECSYQMKRIQELQKLEHDRLLAIQLQKIEYEKIRKSNQKSSNENGQLMILQDNEEVKVQKDQEKIKPIWERKAKAEEEKEPVKKEEKKNEADQINSFVNPKEQEIKASDQQISISQRQAQNLPERNSPPQQHKEAQELVEKLKQSLVEKYGEQIRDNNDLKKEEPAEQIQPRNEAEGPKGRVFISLQLQEEHKDILKAKYHQEEHKGAKIPQINGIRPPAKLDIKENFKKNQKERLEFVQALKNDLKNMENWDELGQNQQIRQSQGDVEEEAKVKAEEDGQSPVKEAKEEEEKKEAPKPVPPSPEEIEKMRNDIEQFEHLNQRHEEMLESQSQIHKGLQDMWRRKLLQQKQQEEKLKKKDEEDPKKGGKKKP